MPKPSSSAPSSAPLIVVDNISVVRRGVAVVRDVSLHIERDDFLTVVGPNGAGKSTLLKTIAGLIKPSQGKLHRASAVKVGYVPQKITANYIFPLSVHAFLTLRNRATNDDVERVATEINITKLLQKPLYALSGGELQKILMARAMLNAPDLLILDEPTQNLDIAGQLEFYKLLTNLYKRGNISILIVSHDLHLVMAATKRVVCMYHHICCFGEPHAIAKDPEFISLLGGDMAKMTAVYHHSHDHRHEHD